ncbi:hypothetical protein FH972_021807 [Carpinus fangiana]|uniref:Mitochondrial genome maintenance protein MGM101 n=1 Tax=Carpinus fangiana TaxID=176857 RepID=A0A5N6KQX9_9ROSI|nr:hypothetical protein FH972_021807 [Carpinus fangiana]
MAPLSTQRIGAGVSWSLNFATRSRSIAFTVSSASRVRRQHRSSQPFSTTTGLSQDPPASTSTKPSIPTTSSNAYQTASPKGSFTERRASKPSVREPPFPTARHESTSATQEPIRDITKGLRDDPLTQPSDNEAEHIDWTTSFHGISAEAFPKETADVLLQPLHEDDIEVKPDGIVYLPEIKYRRILNKAFGPGAWGLAPRGETIVTPKSVTREYALLANGRCVSPSFPVFC